MNAQSTEMMLTPPLVTRQNAFNTEIDFAELNNEVNFENEIIYRSGPPSLIRPPSSSSLSPSLSPSLSSSLSSIFLTPVQDRYNNNAPNAPERNNVYSNNHDHHEVRSMPDLNEIDHNHCNTDYTIKRSISHIQANENLSTSENDFMKRLKN